MARTDDTWQEKPGGYMESSNPLGLDVLVKGTNRYLNFDSIVGNLGYGIRDNNGVMEVKDSGGAWAPVTVSLAGYVPYTGATSDVNLGLNNLSTTSSFGSEMFTSFLRTDWTILAGWDSTNLSDTKINKTSTSANPITLNTVAPTVGKTYKIVVTMDTQSIAGGSYFVWGGVTSYPMITTGTYTHYITAETVDGFSVYAYVTTARFTFNAISIQEVDSSQGNFTVGGDLRLTGTLKSVTGANVASITPFDGLKATNNFDFPATLSEHVGVIKQGGRRLIHSLTFRSLFVGEDAGNFTTTGQYNLGLGYFALNKVTSGTNNTALGSLALQSVTTGVQNFGLGTSAGNSITTGNYNVGIGVSALFRNVSGNNNTAVGRQACYSTTGSSNVAIGLQALNGSGAASAYSRNVGIGENAMISITAGADDNIAIGYHAGYTDVIANTLTTGEGNIFIGTQAGFDSTTQRNYSVAIGYRAKVDANNTMAIGGSSQPLDVIIGGTTASAKLHIVKSTEQFRSGFGATDNYWNAITSSTGVTTFDAVGSGASFIFSDAVTVNSNLSLGTAGNGIYIKEGSNATMGVATLSAGTVVVNTTKVTANSRIFLTVNGGTLTNIGTHYISARTAGTSFTISSTNILDASDIAWVIVEPA